MIERELFAADLVRLMAARGIGLSAVQAWRLASRTPSGLSLTVLAGLCDALGVTPNELITVCETSRVQAAGGLVRGRPAARP
jgi:DNA-binding Xre family transcriptional regulator